MSQFGVPMNHSPLGYRSAEELNQEDEERRELDQSPADDSPIVNSLASYVRTCWDAAKQAMKARMEDRMFKCLRQRKGEHDPDIIALLQDKGSEPVYMMLTDEKCTAAESWLEDFVIPIGKHPFGVTSTPEPDLPPEKESFIKDRVFREVEGFMSRHGEAPSPEEIAIRMTEIENIILSETRKKAEANSKKLEAALEDILEEAKWRAVFKEFIYYFVTFPVAYVKGPVYRRKPTLKWGPDGLMVEDVICKEYDVPSPFDIYPSPQSRDINDGYLIEHHRLTRNDLFSMIGTNSGFDDDAIRRVLDQNIGRDWLSYLDSTRDMLEGRYRKEIDPEDKIDALEFWGSVSGQKLIDWGMEAEEVEPHREYEANVWLIGNEVIKALINEHPLGHKPYFKASFRELKGQFFGSALPEVIRDSQLICNATANNLAENMAIAAGPQVGVDVSQMPPGEDYENIYPRKVWPFDLSGGPVSAGGRQPIWVFTIPSLADELLRVYQYFSNEADTKSGIPKYSYGNQERGGPLSTATGFKMMMENTTRGILKMVSNIDQGVIVPLVTHLFEKMMLDDEEFRQRYRGDVKIVARGSSALVTREQKQAILSEILSMVLGSEELKSIVGIKGIAEIFRKLVAGTDIGVEDVVPSEDEILQQEEMRAEEAQKEKQMLEQMALEKHQAGIAMQQAQAESMLINAEKARAGQ